MRFCSLWVLLIGLAACSPKETTVLPSYATYFTPDTTHWYYFHVDSIAMNDNSGRIDTFHFTMRQHASFFHQQSDQTIWAIERQCISSTDTQYRQTVYWIQSSQYVCEQVYNQLALFRWVSPGYVGQTWNVYINSAHDPFYTRVACNTCTSSIVDTTFQSVFITSFADSSALDHFEETRWYQQGRGCVYAYENYSNCYTGKWSGYCLKQLCYKIEPY